ncbi:hypothetical protein LRB11_05250 [Ectothiorhodospira haloalkaliphila]|uniref:hypothetical protein n=1 Tax=Ectothiorhodospira haloalkaliphila TaxID=421628 RepID=UPI001EE7CD36|nr:hypothetical protein [Ectothiorhodospira haloalkaliphila]MCG5524337.1 hypothetical protein [Ectothiorhodospira haloalkaliphila]
MIIEFTGRPGSGKSTIAAQLQRMLSPGQGRQRQSFVRRMALQAGLEKTFLLLLLNTRFRKHPYISNAVLADYLIELGHSESDLDTRWLRTLLLLRDLDTHLSLVDQEPDDIHIFEEGLAQRGFGAILSGLSNNLVTRHYRDMPLSDLYVNVEVPADIVLQRLQDRDGSTRLYVRDEFVKGLKMELESRGAPIIDIDGTSSTHQAAKSILAHLQNTGSKVSARIHPGEFFINGTPPDER